MESPELDIEQILADATPAETTSYVCTRGDLNARHEELTHRLAVAEARAKRDGANADVGLNDVPEAISLARDIVDLEREMRDAQRPFRFRMLPKDDWDALRKPYLKADGSQRIDPDKMDEFAGRLVAASAVSPRMSEEQVGRLFTMLNAAQREALFAAAWSVNVGTVDIPFSQRASELLERRGSSQS